MAPQPIRSASACDIGGGNSRVRMSTSMRQDGRSSSFRLDGRSGDASDELGQTLQMESKIRERSKVVKQLVEIDDNLKGVDKGKLPWIKTTQAHTTFGAVILANAIFIGIDVEFGVEGFNMPMWLMESFFLVVFCTEISLRVWAERPHFRQFFDSWGIFDTLVTIAGCIDAWVVTVIVGFDDNSGLGSLTLLRMFRLMRLVRLVRVLRMFNELVVLVQTIASSIMAVAWMSLLLFLIVYTGSILTVLLIGQPNQAAASTDPDVEKYFGTLSNALFTHFCIVTLENWPDIAQVAMRVNPWWAVYFVLVIIFTNFALVNLMVGVIVQRIIKLSREQESELASFAAESRQFRNTLQTLFNSVQLNLDNEVSTEDLRGLLTQKQTQQIMSAFGINLSIPSDTLYTIMDIDREGTTTFQEFFDACIRLCGSQQSVHSVFVQHDICKSRRDLSQRMDRIKALIRDQMPGDRAQSIPAPAERAEAQLEELLHRMDKLGRTQEKMLAEVSALKEQQREEASPKRAQRVSCTRRSFQRQLSGPNPLRGTMSCDDHLLSATISEDTESTQAHKLFLETLGQAGQGELRVVWEQGTDRNSRAPVLPGDVPQDNTEDPIFGIGHPLKPSAWTIHKDIVARSLASGPLVQLDLPTVATPEPDKDLSDARPAKDGRWVE